MKKRILTMMLVFAVTMLSACGSNPEGENRESEGGAENKEGTQMGYYMPSEEVPHEGTWIIWPHRYTYGMEYQNEVEGIWVQMTQALHTGENVHIIAYDETEQARIEKLLVAQRVDMKKVDFVIAKSNDVWARDAGPIFVFDENNELTIANFAFDGWGGKTPYEYDDQIAPEVSKQKNIPAVNIPSFVLEGGAVEMDGSGTLMAALSSVVSKNRNSGLTIEEAEEYLSTYFGITNFIWLEGVVDEDVTDAHIDGTARFLDEKTILTVSKKDFAELYESIDMNDYTILEHAKNAKGEPYELIEVPLTKEIVEGADCYGSYLNYYIGNEVVLVPIYEDENDEMALEIIADLYPTREIVPIVVNDLFQYGGMIHCVTQQQPQ